MVGDTNDKPFDDEPFDAGVEADEDSDPKKFIEQLTGKLGQSLRKYTETNGGPDFELEKFSVNSLLSATHTGEMDGNDQSDIIKKVKTSGAGDGQKEEPEMDGQEEPEMDGLDGMDDFNAPEGDDIPDENVNEKKDGFFLDKPKRSSIFAPEGSEEANFKHKIMERLKESFNQETIEPQTKPVTKPETTPKAPNRRNRPFIPEVHPTVQPDPKASLKVIDVMVANENEIILKADINGNIMEIVFEPSGLVGRPEAYDEPWSYSFDSVNSPDGNNYMLTADYYGHPETHLEFSDIENNEIIDYKTYGL